MHHHETPNIQIFTCIDPPKPTPSQVFALNLPGVSRLESSFFFFLYFFKNLTY